MRRARKLAVVALALLTLLSGCKKKKPATPPPQEQAPTISTPPPQPEQKPEEQPPATPQPTPPPAPATTTPPKSKPRKPVVRKVIPKPTPEPEEKPGVVQEGGQSGAVPQLAADLPPAAALQQRQTTAQLQATTEANLRGLTRALSDDEKAMVQQIRAYLQQSRTAATDGDTERAYNLAFKAHLLSNELVKR